MSPLPPVILLGNDCLTGLQIARILWRRGVPVFGLAGRPESAYCRSRALVRTEADTGEAGFASLLSRLRRDYGEEPVVLPCTDRSTFFLADNAAQLRNERRRLIPSTATLGRLGDKARLSRLARQRGWRVPETRIVHDAAELERAANELSLPLVVKPPRRTPGWLMASGGRKVYRFEDRASLMQVVPELLATTGALVVQRWIDGPPNSSREFTVLHDCDGKHVASVVMTKVRQWPEDIGTGSMAREVRDDEIVACGRALLESQSCVGLSQIEYKRDERGGPPILIEINPGRATLNQPLCEAAGVEMTWAWYCVATGRPIDARSLEVEHPGGAWVCWKRDLRAGFAAWRSGRESLRGWLGSYRGVRWSADFQLDDPLPSLLDLARKVRSVLSRRWHRLAESGLGRASR